MNKVILTGYLASDIELKQTQNGVSVASARIAVNRPHNKEVTDFFTLVFWRSTADFVAKYFKKGSGIEVSGVLTSRTWDDQDGNKRYAVEVSVDEVDFGKKTKEETGKATDTATSQEAAPKFEELSEDDDLPF